jgi:hypothetical protein
MQNFPFLKELLPDHPKSIQFPMPSLPFIEKPTLEGSFSR